MVQMACERVSGDLCFFTVYLEKKRALESEGLKAFRGQFEVKHFFHVVFLYCDQIWGGLIVKNI